MPVIPRLSVSDLAGTVHPLPILEMVRARQSCSGRTEKGLSVNPIG